MSILGRASRRVGAPALAPKSVAVLPTEAGATPWRRRGKRGAVGNVRFGRALQMCGVPFHAVQRTGLRAVTTTSSEASSVGGAVAECDGYGGGGFATAARVSDMCGRA